MNNQPIQCPECHTEHPSDSRFCSKCGTKFGLGEKDAASFTKTLQTPIGTLLEGTTFADRYEVKEELGEGGMGHVYRVFDTKIKEDIALKLLKLDIAANKTVLERFSNELRFARKITHKNVCRMHDINEFGQTNFITMEYVEGEDLKSVIKRMGNLSVGNALAIAIQVTDGLAEAHGLGIVHRDLKPQNIMIDKEGNAKIMDFGIARSVEGKGLTVEGMVIGTPEYMSPEQVEGRTADQRADIYALGVIMYEMVTGQVPFSGDSAFSIALKHRSDDPLDPRKYNTHLPDNMAGLILRCMEKSAERRFQKAEELLTELLEIEKTLPEKERVVQKIMPRIAVAPAERFSLKKIRVPALALLTIVAAGIIAWRLLIPTKTPIPASPDRLRVAVLPFKNNSGDAKLDQLSDAFSGMFTTDLMQSKYISVVDESQVFSVLSKLDLDGDVNLTRDNLGDFTRETPVTHFLKGTFIKLGDNYRLDVMLQDARTWEIVVGESEDGVGENALFAMVDSLTKKIKPYLNLTEEQIAEDLDENIADVTSTSPRAIHFYLEAKRALNSRDFDKAMESLENAIALDPDFAMAYRMLSGVYNRICLEVESSKEYWDNISKYNKLALEAANRKPPSKRERLIIEGRNQGPIGQIKSYLELVELYPDDEEGNSGLGAIYNIMREYELAKKHFEILIRNNSDTQINYDILSSIYRKLGFYEKARKLSELSIAKFPDNPKDYRNMVAAYILERDFDNALLWCRKGYELDPNVFTNFGIEGHVYYFMGDFTQAEKEYRKQLASDIRDVRVKGILNLIDLYKTQGRFDDILSLAEQFMQKEGRYFEMIKVAAHAKMEKGNYEESLRLCEELIKPYPVQRLKYLGELYSKMQLWQKVEEVIGEFEKIIEENRQADLEAGWPEPIKKIKLEGNSWRLKIISLRLQGLIEMAKGNYDAAIEHLTQSKSLFRNLHDGDHAFVVEKLALAYFEKGDLEKAKEEYESIGMMTYGRGNHGDIYAKSYYMLGKIHEQQGKKTKAKEYYEKFLDLWKNADPDLPEVDDARARLTAL
jgi:serine/threonine protein kinase/tetratricopeptide (TPR) repeat protein